MRVEREIQKTGWIVCLSVYLNSFEIQVSTETPRLYISVEKN